MFFKIIKNNGARIKHLMFVLFKDIQDMDLIKRLFNYNLNTISKIQTQKFYLLMEYLILILIYNFL
jgi:hypothetical protein